MGEYHDESYIPKESEAKSENDIVEEKFIDFGFGKEQGS